MQVPLARFQVSTVALEAIAKSNKYMSVKFIIGNCWFDDTRPEMKESITKYY